MTGRRPRARWAELATRGPALAVCFQLAACAGARHRKVAGPPPEYERPDDLAAMEAQDGGPTSRSDGGAAIGAMEGGVSRAPEIGANAGGGAVLGAREVGANAGGGAVLIASWDAASANFAEKMLISRDERR